MELIIGSLGVVTLTELGQRVNKQDFKGAAVIIGAILIGLGAGFLHLVGLDPLTGLQASLGAVGIHTVGSAMGGK